VQRRSDGKLAKGPDDEGASTKHGRARGIKEAVKTWWRRERGGDKGRREGGEKNGTEEWRKKMG
jgi:hypothetical protein